jgi:hypothetical protein
VTERLTREEGRVIAAAAGHEVGGAGRCKLCSEVFPCRPAVAAGLGTLTSGSCGKLFNLAKQAYDRTRSATSDRAWGQLDALVAIGMAAAASEAFIKRLQASL